MLNISDNSIDGKFTVERYTSFHLVKSHRGKRVLARIILGILGLLFAILFLPWTQTVVGTGNITSLRPEQRPQTLHSTIDGRIEAWYVREGQYVDKGDTILHISEIKDKYFDPNLLGRTQEQIRSKEMAVNAYEEKVFALDAQISALEATLSLKLQQGRNKVQQTILKVRSDSIDLEAAKTNLQIAERQYDRTDQLYKEGLKSLTDLENRRLKLQNAQAKKISQENKLLTSQNEFLNAQVALTNLSNEYNEKIAKASSEKFASLSNRFDGEATVSKLYNQYSNFEARRRMHYILAPQSGYITQAIVTGLGETIKAGDEILSIMPAQYDLAVEFFIEPFDLPLMKIGQEVRMQFDGWPALVFSGWPGVSTGTFAGEIVAIDNFISENGKYRMLVVPDEENAPWPQALRIGSGAQGLAMLNDVPVWYEIWRQLNGFPPQYYKGNRKPGSTDKNTKTASTK
ncbi:MAG: HlyD family efflux transporter periplasmic adaptor subunit [Bacteroidota bacterium]